MTRQPIRGFIWLLNTSVIKSNDLVGIQRNEFHILKLNIPRHRTLSF